MYTDFYLKFADEAEANSVLYTVHPAVMDEDGNVIEAEYTKPNYINIDTLGVLYEKAPDPLPDPYVPVPLPGWHVNVRVMPGEDAAALEPFGIQPTQPRRVWG